jgi:hypothetical protein
MGCLCLPDRLKCDILRAVKTSGKPVCLFSVVMYVVVCDALRWALRPMLALIEIKKVFIHAGFRSRNIL